MDYSNIFSLFLCKSFKQPILPFLSSLFLLCQCFVFSSHYHFAFSSLVMQEKPVFCNSDHSVSIDVCDVKDGRCEANKVSFLCTLNLSSSLAFFSTSRYLSISTSNFLMIARFSAVGIRALSQMLNSLCTTSEIASFLGTLLFCVNESIHSKHLLLLEELVQKNLQMVHQLNEQQFSDRKRKRLNSSYVALSR